eukprot:7850098-Alexandrium_andersonii.AAC.1
MSGPPRSSQLSLPPGELSWAEGAQRAFEHRVRSAGAPCPIRGLRPRAKSQDPPRTLRQSP